MRYARKLLLVLGLAVLLICTSVVALTVYYRVALAKLMLARIGASTGLDLVPERIDIYPSTFLVVNLDHPDVLAGGHPIARLVRLRLLFNYGTLLGRGGLPLHSIVLDHPKFRLPAGGYPGPARLDAPTLALLRQGLSRLSGITRSLSVIGASLADAQGAPLAEGVELEAYRRYFAATLWRVKFNATWMGLPLNQARVAGDLNLDAGQPNKPHIVARGTVRFGNLTLDGLQLMTGLEARGQLQGALKLTIRDDGSATADSEVQVSAAGLAGPRLSAPTARLDFTLDGKLAYSPERVTVQEVARHGQQTWLSADGYLEQPYSPNPALGLHLGGLVVRTAQLQKASASIRGLPDWIAKYAHRLRSGELRIVQLALDSTLGEVSAASTAITKKLTLDSSLTEVSFDLAPGLKLPPVDQLQAQLHLRKGRLALDQGQARLGDSRLTSISAQADFSRGLEGAPYSAELSGELNMGSLYPPLTASAPAIRVIAQREIKELKGTAGLYLKLSGKLSASGWETPTDYLVTFKPDNVEVALRRGGPPFALVAGNANLSLAALSLDHLTANSPPATAIFTGTIAISGSKFSLERLAVEFRQLPAEQWLPLEIDKSDLAVQGPVSGSLVVTSDLVQPARYVVNGGLTLGRGQVQLGFLRSPILVQEAVLTLAGGGIELSLPNSTLEGHAVDLSIRVADLRNPRLRINAQAQDLDLEAMKFIRLPWSPKTSVTFFKTGVFGHVEARSAHLARLAMADLKLDFTRDSEWRVFNCTTRALAGMVSLDLSGRDADDWIHLRPHLVGVDAAALFSLSDASATAPLVGSLNSDADLWADTNNDFFETLGGTASLVLKHGMLHKFKILSRVLNAIDLTQWLTAKVPDPRIVGLPFDTLQATFAGRDGVFYTDDLILNGPVMTVSAVGNVNVSQDILRMQVGIRPFKTVETVVNKIPLIGRGIANVRGSILAAYVNIHGPIRDPQVTPAPVTSIAEIIKKTLGLPINIIRPNTIN